MKIITISTLDDAMAIAGHISDVQFAELLDCWHRDPIKMVTYQPEGPDGMQARQVQIYSWDTLSMYAQLRDSFSSLH